MTTINRPSPRKSLRPARRSARSGIVRLSALAASLGLANFVAAPALAAPPPISIPAGDDSQLQTSSGPFGFLDGINRSSNLLGDMWGLRTDLSKYGISLALQETSESLGNVSGGTQKGFVYDGLTQMVLQVDTNRAFGHYGGLFNMSVLNIHGDSVSSENLQTLQTASGIEADRSTRLWELWYDQKFLDEDRMDIKIGQQSVDQEFMVSSNALMFVNTMFGWPMLPSADMPAGGPAYPLSALGIRLAARPVNGTQILAGVYNGSPVKKSSGDPQAQDNHGTSFPLGGEGYLAITEVQFSFPALGSLVEPGAAPPLGGTYRLGIWYNSENFADQRLDSNGISLANPASNGQPLQHKGDFSVYAVADQMVWMDGTDPNRTISLFARVMGTPEHDRNLIDFSMNAGMVFKSPFRYRTDDSFGLGMGYSHVSGQVAALEEDNIAYGNNPPGPIQSGETFVEATYQYQVKPWLQLQPDVQYVFRPGGGIPNPSEPTQRVNNELVMGLRANITF